MTGGSFIQFQTKYYLLTFFLFFSSLIKAQTYSSIANGNWNSAAPWQVGVIPPSVNPLPASANVSIRHTVAFNIGGNITNNGIFRIQPIGGSSARLNVQLLLFLDTVKSQKEFLGVTALQKNRR